MEQILLNVDNKNILPSLKRVLGSIDGVTIVKAPQAMVSAMYGRTKSSARKKRTGLEIAYDDLEQGRISPVFTSVSEMFKSLES